MNVLKLTTQKCLQHVQNVFINMFKEHLVAINQIAVPVPSLRNLVWTLLAWTTLNVIKLQATLTLPLNMMKFQYRTHKLNLFYLSLWIPKSHLNCIMKKNLLFNFNRINFLNKKKPHFKHQLFLLIILHPGYHIHCLMKKMIIMTI